MRCAVVGATGEVGRTMLRCLEEFRIPVDSLRLFASSRSAGTTLPFRGQSIIVEELTGQAMGEGIDYLLFSAGGQVSKQYAPIAAAAGSTVIDNSSAFRRVEGIPLVVPEINGDTLTGYHGIIANPNCSTIQLALALAAPAREFGLRKVIVSTYQSVSGAGHRGIATLENENRGLFADSPFPRPIAGNVIPQIAEMLPDGYCFEEDKMHFELKRILSLPDMEVCATTVRVPVARGHAESVYAEFDREIDLVRYAEVLEGSPSVIYEADRYITPIELGDSDDSHVSRLRMGPNPYSVAFWNVGHNVRLGAATNAVRILKHLL
jgi:aspartate-semialdehyde dehydrogenase